MSRGLASLLAGLTLACAVGPQAPPGPAPGPAPPLVRPAPPPPQPCRRVESIAIFKERRLLVARCEGGAVLAYRVAFGRGLAGEKRQAGDQRTPEGRYHVTGPARPSRFHRFLPIDYPSREDADAALAEERIGPVDHARILRAHQDGAPPPADTPLGGGLGLHGEGERWRGDSADLDWTFGCVAMSDAAIDFLADHTPPGTPVDIVP